MTPGAAPNLLALPFERWSASPAPTLAVVAAAALYAYGVARIRARGAAWPARRTAYYAAGLVVLLVALDSGLDAFDDRLLSAHMVQHMLLLEAAPGLLLAGAPVVVLLRALSPAARRRTATRLLPWLRRLGHPAVGLAAVWVAILATHLTPFFGLALRDDAVHEAEHALFLIAGLLFWWPLHDGHPGAGRRLGGLGRLAYVMAAMPPMAIVGAYLDRHAALVYPQYAAPAHALGVSALADQAQAGAIMWVGGTTVMFGVALWSAMAALLADERRQQSRDRRADALAAAATREIAS